MDNQHNTDGQTICEASSEAIGPADNIFFRGKFKANALFIQERNNEEGSTRHAVRSAISVKNVPPSKSSKISVTLAPKGFPLQLLNNGEFYNLCGEIVVTDFRGNFEFRYSSDAIEHIRYTRAASLPSTVSIIGVGTIRRVRLLPSSRNKESGRTDWDYIELLVGHKSDTVKNYEQPGAIQTLMTRVKYNVTGGLTGLDDHACARLIYNTNLSNKLAYGKLYDLKGFLVGAKRHEMPFFMCDIDEKHEVTQTNPKQDIQIRSLGRVDKPLSDLDNQRHESTISVVVCHDGVDEDVSFPLA
ncbi:hypothetical protein PtB15_14B411 [Puccinia triticina]|nr:hypothetical protein PtB15_14B411 [Puccinia triticina]